MNPEAPLASRVTTALTAAADHLAPDLTLRLPLLPLLPPLLLSLLLLDWLLPAAPSSLSLLRFTARARRTSRGGRGQESARNNQADSFQGATISTMTAC